MNKIRTTLRYRGETGSRRAGRALAVGAIGALSVIMLGSVFALLTDTVTFSGGSASSTDWNGTTPPPGATLDLRIKAGPCDPTDDPTNTAVFADSTDVSLAGNAVQLDLSLLTDLAPGEFGEILDQTIGTYCVGNASPYTGRMTMTLLASSSAEVGDCQAAEAAVDSTCLDGDTGELDAFTTIQADGSCGLYDYIYLNSPGSYATMQDLASGGTCELHVNLNTHWVEGGTFGPNDARLLAALSDSISFDLALDLSEI